MSTTQGLAHSTHVRLVARAKELGIEAQFLLERYALHRLLYRLSKSAHADRFVLKGAQLMLVWLGETVRPTRDVDLLGLGDPSDETLDFAFRDLCKMEISPDGMEYLPNSVHVTRIRREDRQGGRRITLKARLGNARLSLQVDVGIGDVITPEPSWIELPSLLDLPPPRLLGYPPETSIAEKLETIVSLGVLNSRLRGYFDILALSKRLSFEGNLLKRPSGERSRGVALRSLTNSRWGFARSLRTSPGSRPNGRGSGASSENQSFRRILRRSSRRLQRLPVRYSVRWRTEGCSIESGHRADPGIQEPGSQHPDGRNIMSAYSYVPSIGKTAGQTGGQAFAGSISSHAFRFTNDLSSGSRNRICSSLTSRSLTRSYMPETFTVLDSMSCSIDPMHVFR